MPLLLRQHTLRCHLDEESLRFSLLNERKPIVWFMASLHLLTVKVSGE